MRAFFLIKIIFENIQILNLHRWFLIRWNILRTITNCYANCASSQFSGWQLLWGAWNCQILHDQWNHLLLFAIALVVISFGYTKQFPTSWGTVISVIFEVKGTFTQKVTSYLCSCTFVFVLMHLATSYFI